MSKYAYKTEITKFGELKVHFPTLDFTKVTKFDAAKQSARDIAKAYLPSCLQLYIDQRREIPTIDDYPFVAERIELDWQTNIRVRLSNWFIKNTSLRTFEDIDEEYSDRYMTDTCYGILSLERINNLFILEKDLSMTDVMEIVDAFRIDVVFHEVKLEFKDQDEN